VILFADEAGIRSDCHAGTGWAPMGETPIAQATGARFPLNMLSAVSAQGMFRFMTVEGGVNATGGANLNRQSGPVQNAKIEKTYRTSWT